MGRHVPPRVAYWLSSGRTGFEAIAGEVALLRKAFPGSAAWGLCANGRVWPGDPAVVHVRWYPVFRIATGVLQHRYDLNHVVGGLGDWHHLKCVTRRPTVLTVAVHGVPCEQRLLDKVDRFIAEWPGAAQELAALGVDPAIVTLVYPPVDLDRFRASERPHEPFRVLFASSPDRAEWLHGRGVDIVLDAAAKRPDMRFVFCWRPWGDALPGLRRMARERGLRNVEIKLEWVPDMAAVYANVHTTVFCTREPGTCKPAPNSVIESLAAGRPAVVTDRVGIADLIGDRGAGAVIGPSGGELAAALDEVRETWRECSERARALAEDVFDQDGFIAAHRKLYEETLQSLPKARL